MEQIVLPEGYELVKEGDKYLIKEKEKKQIPPKSWKEFCERYPIQKGESHISSDSVILAFTGEVFRDAELDKDVCTSEEEAEAFLALMQLRQLRKAWIGDWEPSVKARYWCIFNHQTMGLKIDSFSCIYLFPMSFPTKDMAENFLGYFRDLCETAKILL